MLRSQGRAQAASLSQPYYVEESRSAIQMPAQPRPRSQEPTRSQQNSPPGLSTQDQQLPRERRSTGQPSLAQPDVRPSVEILQAERRQSDQANSQEQQREERQAKAVLRGAAPERVTLLEQTQLAEKLKGSTVSSQGSAAVEEPLQQSERDALWHESAESDKDGNQPAEVNSTK